MSYFNYDDWKLSNPDDDGFYTEETTDEIQETVFFKYLQGYKNISKAYGMITKEGYCVTIIDESSVLNEYSINKQSGYRIETDQIIATHTEQNEQLYQMRMTYKEFAFIDRSEFMAQYQLAHAELARVIANETNN
jgi:hypothetical protein